MTFLVVDVGGPHPFKVLIDEDTDVDGLLVEGAEVEIKAELEDGKLVAEDVEVTDIDEMGIEGEIELEGTITDIVTKDGMTFVKVDVGAHHPIKVLVDEDTDVDGLLVVGAEVEIEAEFEDGRLVAEEIEVED